MLLQIWLQSVILNKESSRNPYLHCGSFNQKYIISIFWLWCFVDSLKNAKNTFKMQINCVKFIFSLSVIFICAWQVNGYLAVGSKRVTRDASNDSELVLPENVNGTVAVTAQGIISQIFSLIGNIFGLSRGTPAATCQCSKCIYQCH